MERHYTAKRQGVRYDPAEAMAEKHFPDLMAENQGLSKYLSQKQQTPCMNPHDF